MNKFTSLTKDYPIELFYCVLFAAGFIKFSIRELEDIGQPLLFAPLCIILIFLARKNRWLYKFSFFLPILCGYLVCKSGLDFDDFTENSKFLASYIIATILLFAGSFLRDEERFAQAVLNRVRASVAAAGVSFIVFLLIVSVMASVENLFEINFRRDYGASVFCFCAFFVFVPCFLSWYEGKNHWRGEILFYILGIAIAVYALLLHIYAGYILLRHGLPRGGVSAIILPYIYCGFALWIVAPALDKFRRYLVYFAPLCVTPLILLFVAIWRRVGEYALTIERYYLIAASICAAIFIALIFMRVRRNLSVMVVLLMVFIAGFALDARELSFKSQISRFEENLARLNLIQNGKIVLPDTKDASLRQNLNKLSRDALYIKNLSSDENLTIRYGEDFDKLALVAGHESAEDGYYYLEIDKNLALDIFGDEQAVYLGALSAKNGAIKNENGEELMHFKPNEFLKDTFERLNLDISKRYSLEEIQKIKDELLVFRDKNATLVFTNAQIYYDDLEKSYKFIHLSGAWLFIKKGVKR